MKYALCVAVAWTFFLSFFLRVRPYTRLIKSEDKFNIALKNLIKFYRMYREKIIRKGSMTKSEVKLLVDGIQVHFSVLLDSSLKLTFLFVSEELEELVIRLENYFVWEFGPNPVMDVKVICHTFRRINRALA